ncbi:glycoside hydrolase family 97 protein [Halalkalicoccus paucihalophilus]|nr:glycoside hydrolase family 97 protein [Halalkalicoccus paucihalophilus]
MSDNDYQGEVSDTEEESHVNSKDATASLPVTRRSVLQGAAAIGPIAGLASTNTGIQSASASTEIHGSGTVTSPNGSIQATVEMGPSQRLDDDLPSGRVASLTVNYDGTTVIEPSPLGITTYVGQFVTSLSLEDTTVKTIKQQYETVGGDKSGQQTLHARLGTLTFGSPNGSLQLELLVSNEGIAYRYQLPGEGHILVDKEVSAFQIPEGSTAWLHSYNNRYESVWEGTDVASASGTFGFPGLFEVTDDAYTLLTEANVDGNYCASHLAVNGEDGRMGDDAPREESLVGEENDRDEIIPENEEFDYDENPRLFELRFAGQEGYGLPTIVDSSLPLETPWRVALIGDLSSIVESNLVAALSEPPQVNDTSWITPGIVDWSWWSDGDSPRDLEIQKQYVDYAAEQGWEYTLVDRGWRREWMPELVDYANDRDVEILVWMVWTDLNTERKRETLFSRLKSWGVSGVKIDYMDSDRQQRMQWYDEVLAATADHELLVNFHGSTLPKGRRRTWPHLLTSEAIYGAEQYKWEEVPASHNVVLPFTRNVVGPMDYTPVTFSATGDNAETTIGHELALSVVFQSDLQHFADSIESYQEYPLAEQFLSEVSAVWDETTFVSGTPEEEATLARCDGDQWFVGSITAGDSQTVNLLLSFLPDDQQYTMRLISDADDGTALTSREQTVTADETVSVDIAENGGFVARLWPSR